MRNIFIKIFLLFAAFSWSNESVHGYIQSLSSEQKTILDEFLRYIVKDQFSGYVLYGNKPMCIEGYYLSPDSGAVTGIGDLSLLIKGVELWQDMQVDPKNKECLFLILDPPGFDYRHLICINRRAFLQTVNENLTLFRYSLGPNLTAEGLLDKLVESKNGFYQVLKNDNTLLGILLGYGTQNSLIVAREEHISDAFSRDRKENFPFISRSVRMHKSSWPKIQEKLPSIGFSSLIQEIEALEKLTVVSRGLRPYDSCRIPYFGCEPDSEETKTLLATYEGNREGIVKALDGNFLEETLSKLFTTTSKTLEVPDVPKQRALSLPQDKKVITKYFAERVYDEIKNERHFNQRFIRSFVKGITAGEKNGEGVLLNRYKQSFALYEIGKELEAQENLMKSNAYFKKLANRDGLFCVVPEKLYSRTLKTGKGNPLTRRAKNVSLHYSFHVLGEGDSCDDYGTIKKESLEYLIPGVALSLIGMKRGEQRDIYIHPEYGYAEDSYLPPNVSIIANIQLLNFEEGDNAAVIPPIFSSKERNHKNLLSEYLKLKEEFFYASGFRFWNHIKKCGYFDCDEFINDLGDSNSSVLKTEEQKNRFINDLHWLIIGHHEFFPLEDSQVAIKR